MIYRKQGAIYIPETDLPAGVRSLGTVSRPGGSDIQLFANDTAIHIFGDGTGCPTAFWYDSFLDWYEFRRDLLQDGVLERPIKLLDDTVVLLRERVLTVGRKTY